MPGLSSAFQPSRDGVLGEDFGALPLQFFSPAPL